jgi:hypothetical protein
MKQIVTACITALMSVAVLVDDAAARAKVQKPRIVISARPPFYWGLGPGGSYGPGPAWYRETHPALFCWYGPCWWARPGR